ncbi:MAG: hypothetical protein H7Y41_07790 [Hyphomonadaceae bacterium]|nr:hypothetical protein [Clostridia bacterium]
MSEKLDRGMFIAAFTYLVLPMVIFLLGWLTWFVAIPTTVIVLISYWLAIKNIDANWTFTIGRREWLIFVGAIVLIAIWVAFSGVGGLSFQNSDHHYRNAIFRDLVERNWPVVYDFGNASDTNKVFLVYYIALWLPAALVGKLLGWYAANLFLYFWVVIGIAMVGYFMCRTIKKISLPIILILIFFSGLDILGYYFMSGRFPPITSHIESWTGIMQFSSNTTLLYWVFNQTIGPWLVISLMLNMENVKSLFFVYALCMLQGPFSFVGLIPFVLYKAFAKLPGAKKDKVKSFQKSMHALWQAFLRCLTFQNVAGGLTVLIISYLYLSANLSGSKYTFHDVSKTYLIFILMDFGVLALLLYPTERRNVNYWIAVVSLMIIPWIRVGFGGDFCMRVSIPALMILMILVIHTLYKPVESLPQNVIMSKQKGRMKNKPIKPAKSTWHYAKAQKVALCIVLLIGACTPILEMQRSVFNTLPYLNSPLDPKPYIANDIRSLNGLKHGMDTDNFVGSINSSVFYQYFAKK